MSKFTFFDKHPELYERGFDYRKLNQQVKFLDKIFSKNKSKKILDIACGHTPQGRKLAKKGYQVSGIDLSGSLLKLAKKRAKEEGVKLKLYKKDMRNFNVGKFDSAYILFSSILHLNNKKDLLLHFKSVNKNLKKGGLYIIDLSSLPFTSPDKPAKFKKTRQGLITNITYTPLKSSKSQARFICTSLFKNKKVNKDSFIVLRFLPMSLLEDLAKETGFEIKQIYRDFKFKTKLGKKPEYIAILKKTSKI